MNALFCTFFLFILSGFRATGTENKGSIWIALEDDAAPRPEDVFRGIVSPDVCLDSDAPEEIPVAPEEVPPEETPACDSDDNVPDLKDVELPEDVEEAPKEVAPVPAQKEGDDVDDNVPDLKEVELPVDVEEAPEEVAPVPPQKEGDDVDDNVPDLKDVELPVDVEEALKEVAPVPPQHEGDDADDNVPALKDVELPVDVEEPLEEVAPVPPQNEGDAVDSPQFEYEPRVSPLEISDTKAFEESDSESDDVLVIAEFDVEESAEEEDVLAPQSEGDDAVGAQLDHELRKSAPETPDTITSEELDIEESEKEDLVAVPNLEAAPEVKDLPEDVEGYVQEEVPVAPERAGGDVVNPQFEYQPRASSPEISDTKASEESDSESDDVLVIPEFEVEESAEEEDVLSPQSEGDDAVGAQLEHEPRKSAPESEKEDAVAVPDVEAAPEVKEPPEDVEACVDGDVVNPQFAHESETDDAVVVGEDVVDEPQSHTPEELQTDDAASAVEAEAFEESALTGTSEEEVPESARGVVSEEESVVNGKETPDEVPEALSLLQRFFKWFTRT